MRSKYNLNESGKKIRAATANFYTAALLLIFGVMVIDELSTILIEQKAIASLHLKRQVIADIYLPKNIEDSSELSMLIINDGQDLEDMPFAPMLNGLLSSGQIQPLLCVGLHCNKYRRDEYGTAAMPDYAGRGARSAAYQKFIVEELLPFLHAAYRVDAFKEKAIAGFSMGGLSAIDTAWNHPGLFTTVGVFSGSLWWRMKGLGDGYQDGQHRIVQQQIRKGKKVPGLRFYFTTGSQDETADRNGNGVIDSIDDTQDVIKELEALGYDSEKDIRYVNFEDGRHDVQTWGRAMPGFLLWGWSEGNRRTEETGTMDEEVREPFNSEITD